MISAAFPGQGSQTPGFLSPWLEYDGVRARLEEFSDRAQIDLIAAGTTWDADAIRDTSVAQPLIVAASIVSYEALLAGGGAAPDGVAGHSVGEIAAMVAAEVIDAVDGMHLVGVRGRAMAEAAAQADSGMSAVVGGVADAVIAAIEEADLVPANYNGPGQIVAAGSRAALAHLGEHPPRGARVIPLKVAGAFHTSYMQSAVENLRAAASAVSVADPARVLYSNADGQVVAEGRNAIERLVSQVAAPVRWDLCMEAFASAGTTGMIELAPAGTLSGLAKRGLKGLTTVAVKTPEDLSAARELLKGASL